VATISWTVLLVATGIGSSVAFAAGAALLGFINVAVGVLVFQAGRLSFHRVFRAGRQAAQT
jgi:hypothetical protein